jgi:hypothetical protein
LLEETKDNSGDKASDSTPVDAKNGDQRSRNWWQDGCEFCFHDAVYKCVMPARVLYAGRLGASLYTEKQKEKERRREAYSQEVQHTLFYIFWLYAALLGHWNGMHIPMRAYFTSSFFPFLFPPSSAC